MSERQEIRLDAESKADLERLCEKSGMDKSKALRQLIGIAVQYRLLEPNWMELLIGDTIELFKEKEKVRLNGETYIHDLRETSKERDRQLQVYLVSFKAFLMTLSESEKKEFFDRKFHEGRALRGEEIEAAPVKIKEGIEVHINGYRVVVKELLKDNFPKMLEGYESNQNKLLKCETGFHIKGSWCRGCESISTCPTIREERLKAISK